MIILIDWGKAIKIFVKTSPPKKKKNNNKKITGSLRFRHVDYFPNRLKILNSIPVKYWKAAYINKNENTLADGLIERTSSKLDEKESKTEHKDEEDDQ